MEIVNFKRRHAQMRVAQVILRQVAIEKMDMLQLREAQLNIGLLIEPRTTRKTGAAESV